MSNLDMVHVPRAWLSTYLENDSATVEVSCEPTSLWELLSAIVDKPAAHCQNEPVLWVTIYRKPGQKDRVEPGPEDLQRDMSAKTWGWSVLHTQLYLKPADARQG